METREKKIKKLTRTDIYVYAVMMDKPTLREDRIYIVAGCYNEYKTKFKNIVTGEIYDCANDKLDLDKLNINGSEFSKIISAGIGMPDMFDIYFTQRFKTKDTGSYDWFRFGYVIEHPLFGDKDWVAKHISMKGIHEFFVNTKDDDEVKLSDVRKIINTLNNISHKQMVKNLKASQEHTL